MRCKWVICCERVDLAPGASGLPRATLVGIFDRHAADSLPTRLDGLCIVFRIDAPELDPLDSHDVRMVIFGPRETRSRPIEGRLRLGMDGQAIWPFELPSPVQFDEAGWQAVTLWVDGQVVCEEEPFLLIVPPEEPRP